MIHAFSLRGNEDVGDHRESTDRFSMEDFYMGDASPAKVVDGNGDFSKITDDLKGNLCRSLSSGMRHGQEEGGI